ncbi:unnamed protein product [Caenorhabditis sp. 36 PRJEB53466]|nr:unnamed protein product [Caenorhabditis sp. 36 PRJEB53466]
MGFLTTALKCVTIVPAVTEVVEGTLNAIERMRSNAPKARNDALKKCKEENERAHAKAAEELNTMYKTFEDEANKSENAAEKRFQQQKVENEKALEKLIKQMKDDEDAYDENVKKMNEAHDRKMQELRSDSKEAREKAEREHRGNMDKLEREHKEEKNKAQAKLDNTKKEGELKIEKAEKEKEAVHEDRMKALTVYKEEMAKLMELNEKQLKAIRDETMQMKKDNIAERRQHLKLEHEETIKQIRERTEDLLQHIHVEHSKDVIRMFQSISEPLIETHKSLMTVQQLCHVNDESTLSIPIGTLDPDVSLIRQHKSIYQNRVTRYRQYVLHCHQAHPEIRHHCAEFIKKMDKVMNSMELNAMCTTLLPAIDNDDKPKIVKFGKAAFQLNADISLTRAILDEGLNRITEEHLAMQPATNPNQLSRQ